MIAYKQFEFSNLILVFQLRQQLASLHDYVNWGQLSNEAANLFSFFILKTF